MTRDRLITHGKDDGPTTLSPGDFVAGETDPRPCLVERIDQGGVHLRLHTGHWLTCSGYMKRGARYRILKGRELERARAIPQRIYPAYPPAAQEARP